MPRPPHVYPYPQTVPERTAHNLRYFRRSVFAQTEVCFAARLGWSPAALGSYEEGRAEMSIRRLQVLCRLCAVSLDSFCTTVYGA